MKPPTHVFVGIPCSACDKGRCWSFNQTSWRHCETCNGSTIMSVPMPLAEFAELFVPVIEPYERPHLEVTQRQGVDK